MYRSSFLHALLPRTRGLLPPGHVLGPSASWSLRGDSQGSVWAPRVCQSLGALRGFVEEEEVVVLGQELARGQGGRTFQTRQEWENQRGPELEGRGQARLSLEAEGTSESLPFTEIQGEGEVRLSAAQGPPNPPLFGAGEKLLPVCSFGFAHSPGRPELPTA